MPKQTAKVQPKFTEKEIDKLLKRQPYDKYKDGPLLIEILARGEGNAAFCASKNISMETFHVWLKKHPEFGEAYAIARCHGQAHYERMAAQYLVTVTEETKEGDVSHSRREEFNQTLWSMIMRNRFGYTEHRRVGVAGLAKIKLPETKDGHAKRFNKLIDAMAEGRLTAHEAQQFGKLIESGAKIFETQELLQRIEALETQLNSGHSDDEFVDEKKPGG